MGNDFNFNSIINIHSCDINVSNRTTYAICEDISSIRNRDGVPTTSGDLVCRVNTHKSESLLFIYTGSNENVAFGPWYLIITGLFILIKLEIMYNIYP